MQENLSRFEALNAQVLGISVDSVWSHYAFADTLGGIDFPMLADFHPKGEVAKQYGIWRADKGFTKRAVVIVDSEGIVRHSEIIESGIPDIEQLLEIVKTLD